MPLNLVSFFTYLELNAGGGLGWVGGGGVAQLENWLMHVPEQIWQVFHISFYDLHALKAYMYLSKLKFGKCFP